MGTGSKLLPRAWLTVGLLWLVGCFHYLDCVGILLASSIDWLPLAIVGLILFGLAKAFADSNMMPILCTVSDPRYRATGYGMLNCFSCIIGGLTIYAGGLLRDAAVDVSRVFQFAAASILDCALLLSLIKPQAAANR